MMTGTIITVSTLIGYSVATVFGSKLIRNSCNKKTAEKINEKIAALPENATQEDIDAIVKKQTFKGNVSYSVKTAILSIGLGTVATGIICNADNIAVATSKNDVNDDNTLIEVELSNAEVTEF